MAKTEPIQNVLNFGGLVTNTTPDKIPDRNATDVTNIDFSLAGMIQSARGYELYGNKITTPGSCSDSFLYQKNFGTLQRVKLRTRDDGSTTTMEWLNPSNITNSTDGQWETLLAGLTTATKMGFAAANGDGGAKVNKLIMGNAVDPMMVWNGATATIVSGTTDTIVCNESLLLEGFDVAGTIIIDGGTEFTYTGITDYTFTGVTTDASGVIATEGVAQKVDTTSLVEHLYSADTISFLASTPATIVDTAVITGEGTVATDGTGTLIGTGTNFTEVFSVGDTLTVDGETIRTIATIPDDETLTVTLAFATTDTGLTYTMVGGFTTAGFTVGQKISVTGSADNSKTWTIADISPGTITLETNELLVAEAEGSIITIQAGAPIGNILLTGQRKLFLSGVKTNPSKVYYSQSGEVTCFGITTGLGSGGSFDLLEGGGPVTCLESKGKNTVVCHKRDAIIAYIRDNDGTNAIENFDTLSESYDSGASNFKARTGLNKTSFFMTGIEGVKILEQAVANDILDMQSLTDIIAPTIEKYDNTNAVAAYFPPKRLLLIATDDESGDRKQISIYVKGSSGNFTFDVSIDDVPVADYIVDGDNLYFVSTLDQNTYKLFARNSANANALNARYATKEYIFDSPAQGKQFNKLYIEGLMNEKCKLKVTVEYGIFGQDNSKSYVIRWDDNGENGAVSAAKVSALGTSVLGETSLGENDEEISDSYIFSAPIHFDVEESTRYKVIFETIFDGEDLDIESYWAVMNCSVNTKLFDISKLKMKNINEPTT